MAHYKRQHYLPSAYLKYFSADQGKCNRGSKVWRLDRQGSRLVPVVSQCSGDYLFSREKAAQTERMFQQSESLYSQCVDKIRSSKTPTGFEYGNLLVSMFDFHLRNVVHKNLTGKEGIDAYKLRNQIFMSKILLRTSEDIVTAEDLIDHLNHNWTLNVLTNASDEAFITSDHPSVWITFSEQNPSLDMVLLPLTPGHFAVAYKKRLVKISSYQASDDDVQSLNLSQMANSAQCIYSSEALADEQIPSVKSRIAQKSGSCCEIGDTSWTLLLQRLLPEYYFSFMQLKPPIY